jgi:hypothetical protein
MPALCVFNFVLINLKCFTFVCMNLPVGVLCFSIGQETVLCLLIGGLHGILESADLLRNLGHFYLTVFPGPGV